MDINELQFETIEKYQAYLKERQELLAYCKKISQGIENLDEKSGERAIWELVQNARDMDKNCQIHIDLLPDKLIFSHHGKPFDYLSLLALVNQNSSKDNPGADLVGQYGTGFMTTHAFSDIVKVDGPYKAMLSPTTLKGYVTIGGFILNRVFREDTEKAIQEMRKEMKQVGEMHKREPLYTELPDEWTSFTYELKAEQIETISNQLASVIQFFPFVLAINERIKEIVIYDSFAKYNYSLTKSEIINRKDFREDGSWVIVRHSIISTDLEKMASHTTEVVSLQSSNGEDVIILPPYPKECGPVYTIPSLFLWFPLLGTEQFGVNFIFHSKRFHPVEKRNNILLPENVPSKLEKGLKNEFVLKEMMDVLFEYYSKDSHDLLLTREMCELNFHTDKDDEVTQKFYEDMQNLWKSKIPTWKVVPTILGKKSMNDAQVRVLHPDFYSKLTTEKRKEYESTLATFAQAVKFSDTTCYLLPTSDLIEWSDTVNKWRCNRDNDFFISVSDVCRSVKTKSNELHKFLMYLKESGNIELLGVYALLPNRKGELKKSGDLRYGDFMTSELYELTELLMGSDADRMIDTIYNDVYTVSTYKGDDLHRTVGQTVTQWRTSALNATVRTPLTDEQLNKLIAFCSATSQPEFTNYRGKMMRQVVRIFGKDFKQIHQPKIIEKEDDFYNSPFNFLLDYTLYIICQKDVEWVNMNKSMLHDFLTAYADSKATDRLEKLDTYGVIPNQKGVLCIKKDLFKNVNIYDKLTAIHLSVMKIDLRDKWVDEDFKDIFTYIEQKASEVANIIQNKLSDDEFKDTIVLDIIELTEHETRDDWKILFKTIYAQRESIRYNLGSPEERKAINRMMKQNNPALLEKMAEVAERKNALEIINNVNNVIAQMEHDAYIKMLGAYTERNLQKFLTEALENYGITIDNQQGGQDFILSKAGYANYHIEVKSRWENDQSVEMSSTQFTVAVENAELYALIGVNMYHFDQERANKNDPMIIDEIYGNIKVLDNIGHLESDLHKRTNEAFRGKDHEIRLNGSYKVRVPQTVFDAYPLDFNTFISRLKKRFS